MQLNNVFLFCILFEKIICYRSIFTKLLPSQWPDLLLCIFDILAFKLVDALIRQEFLKKLNVHVDEAEIKRWHPKFNLDDVPDVEPSELPQPPLIKKFSTAKDVLDEVQDKLNPRVSLHGCLHQFP